MTNLNSENVIHSTAKKAYPVFFTDKLECCGCSACYSICPAGAISMQPDEEGFLYPKLDKNRCLRCYQCVKVCAFKRDQMYRSSASRV